MPSPRGVGRRGNFGRRWWGAPAGVAAAGTTAKLLFEAGKAAYRRATGGVAKAAVNKKAKVSFRSSFGTKRAMPVKSRKRKRKGGKAVPLSRKVAKMSKELALVKRRAAETTAVKEWRSADAGNLLAPKGVQSGWSEIVSITKSTLEGGPLLNCLMVDPQDPSVAPTAENLAAGTYSTKVRIKSAYLRMQARNNYKVPCVYEAYIFGPIQDTSTSPVTAWTNGLSDNPGNAIVALSSTSPLVFLSDSGNVKKLYKVLVKKRMVLQPGQELEISYTLKNGTYDNSLGDLDTATYQARLLSMSACANVKGVLGHDTTITTEFGLVAAGVDIRVDRRIIIEYPCALPLRYVEVSNSLDTFTNNGIVSEMPQANNIAYSSN